MKTSQGNVRVRAYFPAFDLAVDGQPTEYAVVVGLALRGIRNYETTMRLAASAPDAAVAVLRALVDLTILIKWIEHAPKRTIRLYFAADDLERARAIDDWNVIRATRGMPPVPSIFSPSEQARVIRRAHLLRHIAVAHHDRVSRKDGAPLLPSIADRAKVAGDSLELYYMFRMFSQSLHVTARALSADTLHTRRTGTHIRLGRPIPTDFIRGLGVPAICMLLASASRMLGVGCEGELDSLRLQLVGWAPATS